MRRKRLWLLVLILFLGWSQNNRAAETGQPVVSIAAFSGDKSQIPGWSPAFGQAISEMLFETLENTNKNFQVLETLSADNANEAQPGEAKPNRASDNSKKPAANGSANSVAQSVESGGSANCDFVINANVTEFSTQTNSSKIGDFISSSSFSDLGAKWVSARVRIDWRLEDAKTKKVITRGTAMSTAHGSQFDTASASVVAEKSATDTLSNGKKTAVKKNDSMANFFGGMNKMLNGSSSGDQSDATSTTNKSTAGNKAIASSSKSSPKAGGSNDSTDQTAIIGYDNSVFMESALGKATDEAIKRVAQELTATQLPEPDRIAQIKNAGGKVLAVAGNDAIIISLGSDQGLKEGDKLNLYQTVDIKDDKGNVVFTDEKLAGEITLLAVQEDKSRASYSGDSKVQQGWTVKAK